MLAFYLVGFKAILDVEVCMKDVNRNIPGQAPMQMRQKAMALAMKRKEEYLGARVPKSLKDRVIKKAEELQIPVSLLIRRLLEATFGEDSASDTTLQSIVPAEDMQKKVEKVDRYADILGWKTIEVNQDRSCERCREPLPKGSNAALGFTPSNSGYVIVCNQCKSQILKSE